MGLLSQRGFSPIKVAQCIVNSQGFVVCSAEARWFYGSKLSLPAYECTAEIAKTTVGLPVQIELSEKLDEIWSCFEKIQLGWNCVSSNLGSLRIY